MIQTTLKHYIYDVALGAMFNNIGKNFHKYKKVPINWELLNVGDSVYMISNSGDAMGDSYSGIIYSIADNQIAVKLCKEDADRVTFKTLIFIAKYYDWFLC